MGEVCGSDFRQFLMIQLEVFRPVTFWNMPRESLRPQATNGCFSLPSLHTFSKISVLVVFTFLPQIATWDPNH
jgi:hypothetical protein